MSAVRGSFDDYSLETMLRSLALRKRHGELVLVLSGESFTFFISGGKVQRVENSSRPVEERLREMYRAYLMHMSSQTIEHDAGFEELESAIVAAGMPPEYCREAYRSVQLDIVHEVAAFSDGVFRFEPKIIRLEGAVIDLSIGEILLDWYDARDMFERLRGDASHLMDADATVTLNAAPEDPTEEEQQITDCLLRTERLADLEALCFLPRQSIHEILLALRDRHLVTIKAAIEESATAELVDVESGADGVNESSLISEDVLDGVFDSVAEDIEEADDTSENTQLSEDVALGAEPDSGTPEDTAVIDAVSAIEHEVVKEKVPLKDRYLNFNYDLLGEEGIRKAALLVTIGFLLIVPGFLTFEIQQLFESLQEFTSKY
jgi:hypothetical protein